MYAEAQYWRSVGSGLAVLTQGGVRVPEHTMEESAACVAAFTHSERPGIAYATRLRAPYAIPTTHSSAMPGTHLYSIRDARYSPIQHADEHGGRDRGARAAADGIAEGMARDDGGAEGAGGV
eukprot:345645-Rhodomonas_salina.1